MLLILINALRFGAAVEQPVKQTKLFLRRVPYALAQPGGPSPKMTFKVSTKPLGLGQLPAAVVISGRDEPPAYQLSTKGWLRVWPRRVHLRRTTPALPFLCFCPKPQETRGPGSPHW